MIILPQYEHLQRIFQFPREQKFLYFDQSSV